jgi:transposase
MAPYSKGKGVKHLTTEDKASILAYRDAGWSSMAIASRLGRDKATINRILAAAKASPDLGVPSRKKGSGRPRQVTEDVLKALKRQITKYPGMTAGQLRETVPELSTLSDRTVQHALQKYLRMPSRVAALKPLLTEKMKRKRLAFCHTYKNWSADDWAKVMYSDESMFRCIRATRSRVRRPIGSNRYDSKFTTKTVKHPESVMVWGCFSGTGGRGGLYFLPKNESMNSECYEQVLEDHLLPFMGIHGATHFLHDGAPCHASKRVKNFLADKPFQVIDWPGNSPDLNPIENCWNYMKEKLKLKDTSSLPKLINEIKILWTTGLSKEYLKNLSDSMPSRIKKVLAVKGDNIGY